MDPFTGVLIFVPTGVVLLLVAVVARAARNRQRDRRIARHHDRGIQ